MNRTQRIGSGLLAVALLGACGRGPTAPATGEGQIEGRLVLPPTFTNGTPFTQSTPFTNSIPVSDPTRDNRIASTLAGTQLVEAVDPASGRVLAQARTDGAGRFSLALPGQTHPVILQASVRDAWGRIFGLVATSTHPSATGPRIMSAGSTVAPLAGAVSVHEADRVTFGSGFAGIPRPKLARVLAQLQESTTEKAGENFDDLFKDAASGNALMDSVALSADRLATMVLADPAQDPDAIGTRLGTALTMAPDAPLPSPTPAPTPSPAPTPTPRPKPTPWNGVGHAPAVPAPWPPKP